MGTLVKKLIVICNLTGLSFLSVRTKVGGFAAAAIANPLDFASLTPTPAVVNTKVTDGNTIAAQITAKEIELKTLHEQEAQNALDLKNMMQDNWVGQVQTIADGDETKVTEIGMTVKSSGSTADKTEFDNSSPIISKSNQNTSKKMAFSLVNSATSKTKKALTAKGFIAYTQIGGTKPTVHDAMTAENPVSKMKFNKTFASADIGKQFYVIFVWFDTDGNIGPDSVVYSFTII